jgi:hypothetical protein
MTPRTQALPRQPDDPGIFDDAATIGPVRFVASGWSDREIIYLGVLAIGEIAPASGRLARASVRLNLPGSRSLIGCRSMTDARKQAAHDVRQWIDAAGLGAHR